MNVRKVWVGTMVLVTAIVAAACGGGTSNNAADETGTLTVWLMNGSAPTSVIDAVNADFKAKYPKVTVNVEIQQWGDIGTKLDTGFAGSNPPDVMELGNTLVAKYAAAGALADISGKKSSFDNSGTWLQSLTDSCTVASKLYCVPYYAGSRAIIYRKDFFASAGVQPPDSLDGLMTVGQKLMAANSSDPNFSALYFPGKYWYAALPFIWDSGGDIATQSGGKWQGSLSSSGSQQGLTTLSKLVSSLSKADKTGDEAKQDAAFAQGHIAMIIANAWVALLTGNKHMTEMATVGGVIPNTTSMLNLGTGLNAVFYAAAKNSKFVPNSQNWASVENANVLPDMLVKIFTKQMAIPDATKAASDKITSLLNGSS